VAVVVVLDIMVALSVCGGGAKCKVQNERLVVGCGLSRSGKISTETVKSEIIKIVVVGWVVVIVGVVVVVAGNKKQIGNAIQ
jgi:hypothetical protein